MWTAISVIALGSIGFIDSLYLSYGRFSGKGLVCNIMEGCNAVAASPHSVFLGVPLAYIGVLYYLAIIGTGLWLLISGGSALAIQSFFVVALISTVMSLYFIYVQGVLIGAFCMYCLISAALSFILAGLATYLYRGL